MTKRIMIARTDKIGDLILSISSFYMLRKMYPEATIGILVRKYNYGIVKNLPYIDVILKKDDYSEKELIDKIRDFKPDIFVALFSNSFIAKLARKSKASIKIGPYSKITSFFSYNKGVIQKRSNSLKNEAEYNLDLVKHIDPENFSKNYEINTKLYYKEKNTEFVKGYLKKNNIKKYIVVHPFCGGSAKNLKTEEYIDIFNSLKNIEKLHIVISAGPAEMEMAKDMINKTEMDRISLFDSKNEILNSVALINLANCFMGPSTGPMHIASALKKKMIAIFGIKATQSPARWGAFNNSNVKYICPEGSVEEDYSIPHFESYDEKDKENIIKYIKTFIDE